MSNEKKKDAEPTRDEDTPPPPPPDPPPTRRFTEADEKLPMKDAKDEKTPKK